MSSSLMLLAIARASVVLSLAVLAVGAATRSGRKQPTARARTAWTAALAAGLLLAPVVRWKVAVSPALHELLSWASWPAANKLDDAPTSNHDEPFRPPPQAIAAASTPGRQGAMTVDPGRPARQPGGTASGAATTAAAETVAEAPSPGLPSGAEWASLTRSGALTVSRTPAEGVNTPAGVDGAAVLAVDAAPSHADEKTLRTPASVAHHSGSAGPLAAPVESIASSGAASFAFPTDLAATPAPQRAWTAATLSPWLLTAWGLGAGSLVLASLLGMVSLWRRLRTMPAAPAAWQAQLDTLARRAGVKPPRMLRHALLGPLVCWAPGGCRLIVPGKIWGGLTAGERDAVLRHELAHLRHGDMWLSLLSRCVVCLHWFNPLAWWGARRLEEAAEWQADEQLACEAPDSALNLARALLRFVNAPRTSGVAISAVTGGSLERRVQRLLTFTSPRESLMRRLMIALPLMLVLFGGLVGVRMSPWQVEAAEEAVAKKGGANQDAASETKTRDDADRPSLAGLTESASNDNDDADEGDRRTSDVEGLDDDDDGEVNGRLSDGDDDESSLEVAENGESTDEDDESPGEDVEVKGDDDNDDGSAAQNDDDEADVEDDDSAGEDDDEAEPADGERARRVAEFARRILDNGDQNLVKFKAVLLTEPGRIVLDDYAGYYVDQVYSEAEDRALPDYIAEHFVLRGEHYVLAEGQSEFAAQLLQQYAAAREDVAQIETVLQNFAGRIEPRGEAEQLLRRLLTHAATPSLIYEDIRQNVRPDAAAVAEQLGETIVRNDAGRFVVRPSRRDGVQDRLRHWRRNLAAVRRLQAEFRDWADELVATDDRSRALREALADPFFAVVVARDLIDGEHSAPLDEEFDYYFGQLEEATDDSPEGLRLTADLPEQHAGDLDALKRMAAARPRLQEAIEAFLGQTDLSDPLTAEYASLLRSDLGLVVVGRDNDFAAGQPAKAATDELSYLFADEDADRLVIAEDRLEEVSNYVANQFARHREIRRRGRIVDEFAGQLADPQLQQVYASVAGKLLLNKQLEDQVRRDPVDGLALWIADHFEETANGYLLKDGMAESIANLVSQASEVEQQLSQDDF